jgi:PBP1b-binding outer membrane lipoprotein LpoB
MMKSILFLLALAAICSGCVSTYTANPVSRVAPLRTNATVLVALPEDGRFEKIVYPG